ncbi:EAL domain-containing protein [Devosia sp.]|uniref:EAL domain-containing protein n=1 Tax=Devosia sp. TaxID=1871048 RepID=UPI001AD1734C|nr:EAL domain-containing protein [Devosia sp.]MBN9335013.1 EAL domain-containing protein [Devosia sp.]
MSGLVSFLISTRHQSKVKLALWVVCFLALLAASAWFVHRELRVSMDAEAARVLETYTRIRGAVLNTLDTMERELTAPPCSAQYAAQQRRVAFLAEGMNELFFFENGKIICTANSGLLPKPIDLGAPDIPAEGGFSVTLWLSRSLEELGLGGLKGAFAVWGNNGVLVRMTPIGPIASKWLEFEVVLQARNGRWWHTSGEPGLYASSLAEPEGLLGLRDGAITTVRCDPAGPHCLAARATWGHLLALGGAVAGLCFIVCGIVAAWLSAKIYEVLARRWSFEQRFLRRFQSRGIVCAYQPLLKLDSDLVTGCEVLARWRDVDGTLIYPDRFIPIVEAHGFTRAFTRLVATRAHAELLPLVPLGRRLQVNFNIFPRDLDAAELLEVFAPFLGSASRFDLSIEIVETGALDLDRAQVEIEHLRAAGVQVYIDDFGAGYSSMHTLAGLSVDGVKLDRSFAMAPDDSVMSRMLDHAIDMVQDTGRKVVVEGVETSARLAALKAEGKVDFAQGYYISRPLDCIAFGRFLSDRGPRPGSQPRLVA